MSPQVNQPQLIAPHYCAVGVAGVGVALSVVAAPALAVLSVTNVQVATALGTVTALMLTHAHVAIPAAAWLGSGTLVAGLLLTLVVAACVYGVQHYRLSAQAKLPDSAEEINNDCQLPDSTKGIKDESQLFDSAGKLKDKYRVSCQEGGCTTLKSTLNPEAAQGITTFLQPVLCELQKNKGGVRMSTSSNDKNELQVIFNNSQGRDVRYTIDYSSYYELNFYDNKDFKFCFFTREGVQHNQIDKAVNVIGWALGFSIAQNE